MNISVHAEADLTAVAHNDLASQIGTNSPTNDTSVLYGLGLPTETVMAMLNGEVTRQAVFIAYLDDFKLMMIVTFAVLPLLVLMRKGQQAGGAGPQHAAMD